jgi:hypothetical protein
MPIHWGDIQHHGCVGPGSSKYSAILWDIPFGQSWEGSCAATPAPGDSAPGARTPDRCVNTGLNIWGEWYVADDACRAHWETPQRTGCSAIDTAQYSAILWDIPAGQTWEEACATTPGPAGSAVAGRSPDRCKNTGLHMWGEWDVADQSCRPKWGPLQGGCIENGLERYSAILWEIPANVSWEDQCRITPAPEDTPVAGRVPTRCVNTGLNIWGEWDVANTSCVCEDRQVVECHYTEEEGTVCDTHTVRVCYHRPSAIDPPSLIRSIRSGIVLPTPPPRR